MNNIEAREIAEELIDEDDEIIECWCGARGTYDQLFEDADSIGGCGGLGEYQCYCGGDLCVCHNHGSIECDGCRDCEDVDDDDFE